MDTTNALERLATITPRRYPQGSTIERRPDGRVFVWYPKGERVTVKLGGPAPWEILSAADARRAAYYLDVDDDMDYMGLFKTLNAYADAVDAMTQPTRIEYETQEWESKQ